MRRFGGVVVAGVLVVLSCVGVGSGVAGASSAVQGWGSVTSPVQGPAPMRGVGGVHGASLGSAVVSTNWAGYEDSGSTFSAVSGVWTVSAIPAVSPSAVAQWVGIDGVTNSDLIQAGTTEEDLDGSVSYFAWWEILPAYSVPLGPVSPGDQIEIAISEDEPGTWSISVQDLTSGEGASGQVSYSGPGTTAEWITEDPVVVSGGQAVQPPLADFGSTTFSDVQFASLDTSASVVSPIDMANAAATAIIAYPSAVSADNTFTVTYGAPPTPPPAPPPSVPVVSPTPPAASPSGYDMVGADGGVFVFSATGDTGGFYGSLPALGVRVDDVVGMVPSSDDRGYFLVASDGGVFSFGDASFAGSLPGDGVQTRDIAGIVPTSDNHGYFLVGDDGGVFAFGDAPFLGSLPGEGITVSDVIGIAATPDDQGYWVVEADGTIRAFGDAPNLGSVTGSSSPVAGIAATSDGGGYWVVTKAGGVYPFGDAENFGSLPDGGVTPSKPIIGLVPTADQSGYWLIGSDGGIFAYGDARFEGSLPALGVNVTNIVGAVPTR